VGINTPPLLSPLAIPVETPSLLVTAPSARREKSKRDGVCLASSDFIPSIVYQIPDRATPWVPIPSPCPHPALMSEKASLIIPIFIPASLGFFVADLNGTALSERDDYHRSRRQLMKQLIPQPCMSASRKAEMSQVHPHR
jgi:hypothetical protein